MTALSLAQTFSKDCNCLVLQLEGSSKASGQGMNHDVFCSSLLQRKSDSDSHQDLTDAGSPQNQNYTPSQAFQTGHFFKSEPNSIGPFSIEGSEDEPHSCYSSLLANSDLGDDSTLRPRSFGRSNFLGSGNTQRSSKSSDLLRGAHKENASFRAGAVVASVEKGCLDFDNEETVDSYSDAVDVVKKISDMPQEHESDVSNSVLTRRVPLGNVTAPKGPLEYCLGDGDCWPSKNELADKPQSIGMDKFEQDVDKEAASLPYTTGDFTESSATLHRGFRARSPRRVDANVSARANATGPVHEKPYKKRLNCASKNGHPVKEGVVSTDTAQGGSIRPSVKKKRGLCPASPGGSSCAPLKKREANSQELKESMKIIGSSVPSNLEKTKRSSQNTESLSAGIDKLVKEYYEIGKVLASVSGVVSEALIRQDRACKMLLNLKRECETNASTAGAADMESPQPKLTSSQQFWRDTGDQKGHAPSRSKSPCDCRATRQPGKQNSSAKGVPSCNPLRLSTSKDLSASIASSKNKAELGKYSTNRLAGVFSRKCRMLQFWDFDSTGRQNFRDLLAVSSLDGNVRLFDSAKRDQVATVSQDVLANEYANTIAWAREDVLACGSSEKLGFEKDEHQIVLLHDLESRERGRHFIYRHSYLRGSVQPKGIGTMCALPRLNRGRDEVVLATSGLAHVISIWRASRDSASDSFRLQSRVEPFPEIHSNEVRALCHSSTSANAAGVLWSGGLDKSLVGYDLEHEAVFWNCRLPHKIVSLVKNSLNPHLLLVGYLGPKFEQLQFVDVRVSVSHQFTSCLPVFGLDHATTSKFFYPSWSANGNFVCAGAEDSAELCIWDIRYNKLGSARPDSFKLHEKKIISTSFHPQKSGELVSVSNDHSLVFLEFPEVD